MPYELWWSPQAQDEIARVEGLVPAVWRVLGRLEADPDRADLGTVLFLTADLEPMRATPVGVGDLHVFWQPGPVADAITVLRLADLAAGLS